MVQAIACTVAGLLLRIRTSGSTAGSASLGLGLASVPRIRDHLVGARLSSAWGSAPMLSPCRGSVADLRFSPPEVCRIRTQDRRPPLPIWWRRHHGSAEAQANCPYIRSSLSCSGLRCRAHRDEVPASRHHQARCLLPSMQRVTHCSSSSTSKSTILSAGTEFEGVEQHPVAARGAFGLDGNGDATEVLRAQPRAEAPGTGPASVPAPEKGSRAVSPPGRTPGRPAGRAAAALADDGQETVVPSHSRHTSTPTGRR